MIEVVTLWCCSVCCIVLNFFLYKCFSQFYIILHILHNWSFVLYTLLAFTLKLYVIELAKFNQWFLVQLLFTLTEKKHVSLVIVIPPFIIFRASASYENISHLFHPNNSFIFKKKIYISFDCMFIAYISS